jgi:hypothetical protein
MLLNNLVHTIMKCLLTLFTAADTLPLKSRKSHPCCTASLLVLCALHVHLLVLLLLLLLLMLMLLLLLMLMLLLLLLLPPPTH